MYMRGPSQHSNPLYSQLTLRICGTMNGLGGGTQTDFASSRGKPYVRHWLPPKQSLKTPKVKYETLEISRVFINPFHILFRLAIYGQSSTCRCLTRITSPDHF